MTIKKELTILVGNIGSGKTTLCKKLAEEGNVIISQDDLRYSIGAGQYIFNESYEPLIKRSSRVLAYSFMEKGIPLVIDETNMSRIIRSRYLSIAELYEYKIKAIIFPALSKEESVHRRLQSNHGNTPKVVWEEVWDKFNDMYEEPTKLEGFDEIIKL